MATSIRMSREMKVRQELMWLGGVAVLCALGFWLWTLGPSTSSPADGNVSQTKSTAGTDSSTAPAKTLATASSKATDIASVALSIPEASRFADLFRGTGVSATLKSTGTYTIFVPTNKAFTFLPAGTITNLNAAERKRFVEYSVVPDRKVNIGAMYSGSIPSMTREPLNFIIGNDGVARVNGASVVKTYQADNGIVYLIDQVLLPPKKGF